MAPRRPPRPNRPNHGRPRDAARGRRRRPRGAPDRRSRRHRRLGVPDACPDAGRDAVREVPRDTPERPRDPGSILLLAAGVGRAHLRVGLAHDHGGRRQDGPGKGGDDGRGGRGGVGRCAGAGRAGARRFREIPVASVLALWTWVAQRLVLVDRRQLHPAGPAIHLRRLLRRDRPPPLPLHRRRHRRRALLGLLLRAPGAHDHFQADAGVLRILGDLRGRDAVLLARVRVRGVPGDRVRGQRGYRHLPLPGMGAQEPRLQAELHEHDVQRRLRDPLGPRVGSDPPQHELGPAPVRPGRLAALPHDPWVAQPRHARPPEDRAAAVRDALLPREQGALPRGGREHAQGGRVQRRHRRRGRLDGPRGTGGGRGGGGGRQGGRGRGGKGGGGVVPEGLLRRAGDGVQAAEGHVERKHRGGSAAEEDDNHGDRVLVLCQLWLDLVRLVRGGAHDQPRAPGRVGRLQGPHHIHRRRNPHRLFRALPPRPPRPRPRRLHVPRDPRHLPRPRRLRRHRLLRLGPGVRRGEPHGAGGRDAGDERGVQHAVADLPHGAVAVHPGAVQEQLQDHPVRVLHGLWPDRAGLRSAPRRRHPLGPRAVEQCPPSLGRLRPPLRRGAGGVFAAAGDAADREDVEEGARRVMGACDRDLMGGGVGGVEGDRALDGWFGGSRKAECNVAMSNNVSQRALRTRLLMRSIGTAPGTRQ